MTDQDRPRFLQALTELARVFRDPLPPDDAECYWRLYEPRVTLAEWEYAVEQAKVDLPYYHVPLPVHMLEYVRAYRQAQRPQEVH